MTEVVDTIVDKIFHLDSMGDDLEQALDRDGADDGVALCRQKVTVVVTPLGNCRHRYKSSFLKYTARDRASVNTIDADPLHKLLNQPRISAGHLVIHFVLRAGLGVFGEGGEGGDVANGFAEVG